MIDAELKRPLKIHVEGDAGPYLMVPIQQLSEVEGVLVEAGVSHSISRDAIQLDGHEAIAIIDFGRRAIASQIQAILDRH